MRSSKYYTAAVFWTLALAIPAGLLALAAAASFDRFVVEIGRGIAAVLQADWPALAGEFSGRLPEVGGMLIGQLLLLAVLLIGGSRALRKDAQAG